MINTPTILQYWKDVAKTFSNEIDKVSKENTRLAKENKALAALLKSVQRERDALIDANKKYVVAQIFENETVSTIIKNSLKPYQK